MQNPEFCKSDAPRPSATSIRLTFNSDYTRSVKGEIEWLEGWDGKKFQKTSQRVCLLPLLTVTENVTLPMEMQGIPLSEARKRASEALELVGIAAEKHKRFPSALSGGEQQRVAIARSLCSGARVLLADEPTGNLDGENTQIVMELLCRMSHEEGRCVIVVTHDMEVAEMADTVLRMKDGMLLAG